MGWWPVFCTKCGASIPEGATFCTNCGTPLSSGQTGGTNVADGGSALGPGDVRPSRPKRSRGLVVAAIVLCVVALVAVGLVLWEVVGPGLPFGREAEDTTQVEAVAPDASGESDAEPDAEPAPDAGDAEPAPSEDDAGTAPSDETTEPTNEAPSGSASQGMAAVTSVTASSVLPGDSITSYYGPNNLIDGSLSTGWVEGVDGSGVGQWFQLDFATPQDVHGVVICPGYAKSRELFEQNGCPTKVRVHFSDGAHMDVVLEDALTPGVEMQSFGTEEAHRTDYLRVEILEVRPGSSFDDTVVSEFSFY